MIGYLIMVPIAYLLGSLPFGIIVGWATRRIDVRDYGSGKTGMTNVLRTIGVRAAAVVLLLDMGKSVLSVVLARIFFDSHGVEAASALAALAGHNWPIFVGFRGGRGTAPGWGGLLILSPLSGLIASMVGVPTVAISRYVSLGSILGTLAGVIALLVLVVTGNAPLEYVWFGVIGASLVVGLHKDNIRRLIKGQERKIGQDSETIQSQPNPERRKGLRWPKSV